MSKVFPRVDPDGLLEYSVVFTDRALNHMSQLFQHVMQDISGTLKHVYSAHSVALVPGGGTYAMEAVARQYATGKRCLVIRNGWFSYRWTQIFDMGNIPASTTVLKARPVEDGPRPTYAPPPLAKLLQTIREQKPDVVFAPHVETAAGMILPEDYVKAVGNAVHEHGGLFVLDCIASGTVWVNMQSCGVDILISAPQKGWSAPPSCGLVMLGASARERIEQSQSTSFACDLRRWLQIMETYEGGGHAYHATMPTDALTQLRDTMIEMQEAGFESLRQRQIELGRRVRELLAGKGLKSLAAESFAAPGVVVCHTTDSEIQNGKKFLAQGLQAAAGVPLMCDEPADFKTFRIGLFGLDKLSNIERTVQYLETALDKIVG